MGCAGPLIVAVVVAGLAAVVGLAVWWPSADPDIHRDTLGYADRVHATVTSASAGPCAEDPALDCVVVGAELTSGPDSGGTATITTTAGSDTVLERPDEGDRIVLNDTGGAGPPATTPTTSGPTTRGERRPAGQVRTTLDRAVKGWVRLPS